MARFDLEFELEAEGITLNGNEVCYKADPVKELVADANDLGDTIVELVQQAKRVLGIDREPLSVYRVSKGNFKGEFLLSSKRAEACRAS